MTPEPSSAVGRLAVLIVVKTTKETSVGTGQPLLQEDLSAYVQATI